MRSGEILEIRLVGAEPLRNVPESLSELGHEILSLAAESDTSGAAVHRLLVRKA